MTWSARQRTGGEGGGVYEPSPLELVTQAFVVRAVQQQTLDSSVNGNFDPCCDNQSPVQVVAAGRARSPAPIEALRIVRVEVPGPPGGRRLRMCLEHTYTMGSKVADLLSRGEVAEARAMVIAQWRRCRVGVLYPPFMANAEERVRLASGRNVEAGR